jgi:ABC-type polar amino acid transport system ATPase subunit
VSAVLEISHLSKTYGGLRPLRVEQLSLTGTDQVAIVGIDQPAAEMLVNLMTGASLPDAGDIRVFGRATADIKDSVDWLETVDRFGIVTDRAVLLDGLSVVQNLAIPFSLDIEPPSADLRLKAIALAREAGLDESSWDRPVSALGGAARARVRFGRALALGPALLLLEHPTAAVERESATMFGRDIRGVAERRGIATLTLTADGEFAAAVASRVLTLEQATGRLAAPRRWFGRK